MSELAASLRRSPGASRLATDALFDGAEPITPKFARVNAALDGQNELVAAVAGKKIRVLCLLVSAVDVNVNVTFRSGATTILSGLFLLRVDSNRLESVDLPFSPIGHFETAAGEALTINNTAGGDVGGHLVYIEV